MLARSAALLLAQAALGSAGWWWAQQPSSPWPGGSAAAPAGLALVGVVLATVLWLLWDGWQAQRLLGWLRTGELHAAPRLWGVWGEAATRSRRWHRLQAQEAAQSAQRLTDILSALQASPNGVVLLDARGCIEWCNQLAEQFFGLQAERDVQQSLGNLLRDPAFNAYWARRDFTQPVLLHGRESTPGRPVRLAVQLFAYGDGRYLLLARDITLLEQAEAMRRDFVANVTHEIRTPLTVLVGFVETLQTLQLTDDERQRYLALMAQQASRMQHLVQDLLALSRLEGSPLPPKDEWTPLAALVQRCAQEAQGLSAALTRASGTPHQLNMPDLSQLPWEIAGSSGELQSMCANLLNNAVRYTPAGGTVTLQWHMQPDGSGTFSVTDTGHGVEAVHLPRLTERFYRIDRSRSRDTGGTGLGLAIVKHVLQRHGAQLHITSEVGKGSCFAATFPASRLRQRPPSEAGALQG